MLNDKQIDFYLVYLENQLLKQDKKNIELTQGWVELFPSKPGVYVVLENDKPIYVGETGNIRKRMRGLLDTRHHTLRRAVGKRKFCKKDGYRDASSKHKFPDHIEKLVVEYIKKRFEICSLPVSLGRKELEERIMVKYDTKYNNKGPRKNN